MRISFYISILFLLISCGVKKKSIESKNPKNSESQPVKLEFNILEEEVKNIRGVDFLKYRKLSIPAVLSQTNISEKPLKLLMPRLIIYENFEIKDSQDSIREDLRQAYHINLIFHDNYTTLSPGESITDTVNLIHNFYFNKAEPESYKIRVKKTYFDEWHYSNWDTLSIK